MTNVEDTWTVMRTVYESVVLAVSECFDVVCHPIGGRVLQGTSRLLQTPLQPARMRTIRSLITQLLNALAWDCSLQKVRGADIAQKVRMLDTLGWLSQGKQ